jgi:acetolactate synthase I/II/III large subunit
MNLSEKIINFLEKKGVTHCYLVTGGHAMHLNNALFKSKIKPIFCHHEQAAAMAAEGYGRIAPLGLCMVTAGPGCVNALNGVLGAFADSTPMMVLSGANNSPEITYMKKYNMRQVGLQGFNIEAVAKPIVKYFKTVTGVNDIKEAYEITTTDRKGPVWLEIPLDQQTKPY